MASFPIFSSNGFSIGIGDANRDGKLDFDFGLRSDSYGNSPFGFGHSGAEIGFNTSRGLYAGGDYSNSNIFGSSGGGGRVFSDGGFESGSWANDVFGNYGSSYQNASPFGYESMNQGGNVFNGNYYGNQSFNNGWEAGASSWGGNAWNGANYSMGSYGNVFGGGGSWGVANPPFVPSWGGGYYGGAGCGCASNFLF